MPRRGLSFGREIALTRACILFTTLLALHLAWSLGEWLLGSLGGQGPRLLLEEAVFVAGGAVLLYGNLVYQFARLGYLQRNRAFVPARPDELKTLYDGEPPRMAVMIPSYREDPRLVRMTMLSAALQEHPRHRVVLLIDDPPEPTRPEDVTTLQTTRRLADELQGLLDEPANRFAATHEEFEGRRAEGLDLVVETRVVAALMDEAAEWFEHQAARFPHDDHVEHFFVREVLEAPAAQHRTMAAELRRRAVHSPFDQLALTREHRRLAALFAVELTSFERKRYANLSHKPNKAMNLNSYIGLLGNRYRTITGPDGEALEVDEAAGTVSIPAVDYLITLDADSLLLPEYALRLIHLMEQPGNERIALAQTPYSAFPEAPGRLERVAGATTDIMCLVHQGTSRYNAAYWVGANALVRRAALEDIAEHGEERGYPVTRYIQDRTLNEDTESSIDFVRRGWRLANYPARLAYSATPPDFGSLLIQRRRWANGGLLILPKLLGHAAGRPGKLRRIPELTMQLHYLTSVAGVNVAFLILMAYPFEGLHVPMWLPLLALPYFGLYARDLVQTGYRYGDVVRVYALTLLLIPVNLGGVLKSLQQACTGRQVPFGRTPKVTSRTPVPALYVLATLGLLAHWLLGTFADVTADRAARAVFAALNVGLLAYAATRFMGWRAAADDLSLRFRGRPLSGARRGWLRPLPVLGLTVLVPVGFVVALLPLAHLRMDRAEVSDLSAAPFPRMNVLVVGTDSRKGLTEEERRRLSLGDFEGSRADTIFLLSVEGRQAATLALPRDLLVTRCDGSRGRINAALQIDGPRCLIDTVEDLSGVPVSHYVQVDFAGMVGLVDAVGGVRMALDEPIVDPKAGANLPSGEQQLSGAEALAFARSRGVDDDLGRIGRQQELVQTLADEVESPTLLNPLALTRLTNSGAGALTVDRDLGPFDLARIGLGVGSAAAESMPTFLVPAELKTVGGKEVLVGDEAEARPIFDAFVDGSALRADPDEVGDIEPRAGP